MGVDWLTCSACEDNFPDCGPHVHCECGVNWCSDECAESEGRQEEEDGFTPEGSKWEQETSCNFCRNEDFSDYVLLEFSLKLLKIDRKELALQYKASKEER